MDATTSDQMLADRSLRQGHLVRRMAKQSSTMRIREAISKDGAFISEESVRPTISAADLISALRALTAPEASMMPIVLKVVGVEVHGPLELAGFGGDDASPISLTLERCLLRDGVRITHSRFLDLSFAHSEIPAVHADGVHVDGDLNLTGIAPGGQGACWVSFEAAHVGGQLKINRAVLHRAAERHQASLNLQRAEIVGGISATGLRCSGGIDLRFAEVGGPIDLGESRLRPTAAGSAVQADQLHCKLLSIERASVRGAIEADDARVEGPLLASGLLSRGGPLGTAISFSRAQIGGGVDLSGARFRQGGPWRTDRRPLIDGQLARIGSDVRLSATRVRCHPWEPAVMMRGAAIDGSVQITDVQAWGALVLRGAQCRGDCFVSNADGFEWHGALDCHSLTVGGTLDVRGTFTSGVDLQSAALTASATLAIGPTEAWSVSLNAGGVACERNLQVILLDPAATALFEGAKVKGNLRMEGRGVFEARHLARGVDDAIMARDVEVGGSLFLEGAFVGGVDLVRARVRGDVVLGTQSTDKIPERALSLLAVAPDTKLALADAEIAGQVRLYGELDLQRGLFDGGDTASMLEIRQFEAPFYPGWSVLDVIWSRDALKISTPMLWDGRNTTIFVDGTINPLYAFNERRLSPTLNDSTVCRYVRFLLGMTTGSEGRLHVDMEADAAVEARGDGGWIVPMVINYGGGVVGAKISVDPTGRVSFAEQRMLGQTDDRHLPFLGLLSHRLVDAGSDLPLLFEADWKRPDPPTAERLHALLRLLSRPIVDLSGMSCSALDDEDGRLWSRSVRLELEGISVRRFAGGRGRQTQALIDEDAAGAGSSSSSARRRVEWLRRQVQWRARDWSPQPYEAFARTYRLHGFNEEANVVAAQKARLELKTQRAKMWAPARSILGPVYEWGMVAFWGGLFRYGLSPSRALLTCLACIVVGWLGVEAANNGKPLPALGLSFDDGPERSAMQLSMTPVQGVFVRDQNSLGVQVVETELSVTTNVPCGPAIDAWIYATDLFIPLLDLREEGVCGIRQDEWARPWRIAKALYAALGWLVLSLTVLTLSAPLRRQTGG